MTRRHRLSSQEPPSKTELGHLPSMSERQDVPLMQIYNLIHDINNALMLVTITSEKIEQTYAQSRCQTGGENSQSSASKPLNSQAVDIQPFEILRDNVGQLRDLVQNISDLLPPKSQMSDAPLSPLVIAKRQDWTAQDFIGFFGAQKREWALIAPPETQIMSDVASFTGHVAVNASTMSRMVQNLVRNACEAYVRGGNGFIISEEKPLQIRLMTKQEGATLAIHIIDNGPGIADELQQSLFAPYITTKIAAEPPDTTSSLSGMGLGSARDAAEQLGGSLVLHHSDTLGSHFIFHLPLITAQES